MCHYELCCLQWAVNLEIIWSRISLYLDVYGDREALLLSGCLWGKESSTFVSRGCALCFYTSRFSIQATPLKPHPTDLWKDCSLTYNPTCTQSTQVNVPFQKMLSSPHTTYLPLPTRRMIIILSDCSRLQSFALFPIVGVCCLNRPTCTLPKCCAVRHKNKRIPRKRVITAKV